MSRRMTGMLKGIGIGMVLCAVAMECYKIYSAMKNPKYRRKRCAMKRDANRALRVMGDMIDDVGYLFQH
ncbi:MAG: hypothetical protein PUC32_07260 [Oscillospiraceae bacterium]|nr:hypothetical protein [Oscillospiraceae bacterium]